jgi:ketose-bisphosphate aldolase
MLANTIDLLRAAREKGVAVGAFNTYNLEITRAIVDAAEQLNQPVILQLGMSALKTGGEALARAMLAAASAAHVPVALHLDHCTDIGLIETCFAWGFSSALADGARLPFDQNVAFTSQTVQLAARYAATIEAELGYLAGTEDGITVEEVEVSLTDPRQARELISRSGAAMLAVAIGNVHGYTPKPPPLDFARLAHITAAVDVPLVLHGASGIAREDIHHAIRLGIAKLNVNTEVRAAYLKAIAALGLQCGAEPDLRKQGQDVIDLMQEAEAEAEAAASSVVENTIRICNFF